MNSSLLLSRNKWKCRDNFFYHLPEVMLRQDLRCRNIVSFLPGSFYCRDSEENVTTFSALCLSQFMLLLLFFLLLVMLIPAK